MMAGQSHQKVYFPLLKFGKIRIHSFFFFFFPEQFFFPKEKEKQLKSNQFIFVFSLMSLILSLMKEDTHQGSLSSKEIIFPDKRVVSV